MGELYCGDNLDILQRVHGIAGTVDLIYLDPPFLSDRDYNIVVDGKPEVAFRDKWEWNQDAEKNLRALTLGQDDPLARCIEGLHGFLPKRGHLAYLVSMARLLGELRKKLKPSGSIYLHCDPSASHYLKIIMDAIFGRECFLNEVIWMYGLGGSSPRYWPRKHDVLLWYSSTENGHYFEADRVPATSSKMKGQDKKAPDYWDIPSLNNMAKERNGYPTQKPEALLERIIRSSCPEGGLVLDPCCGSGTTLAVAERLGRKWVGIDMSAIATAMTLKRLAALEQQTQATLERDKMRIPCGVYGCTAPKHPDAVFCSSCAAEYREDPDAFK